MNLTFNPLQAMVMTYICAKVQGQQSVSSKDRAETNGRTDGGDCITSLANVVGNNTEQNITDHYSETHHKTLVYVHNVLVQQVQMEIFYFFLHAKNHLFLTWNVLSVNRIIDMASQFTATQSDN